ncbi:P-loop containing nucleoside triphosphate hydrolase protein [Xylaria sp. FL0933]|nr:P-loop containing nucleoside triphosphate hydrolase protein [Xylaria sp. FL0933]
MQQTPLFGTWGSGRLARALEQHTGRLLGCKINAPFGLESQQLQFKHVSFQWHRVLGLGALHGAFAGPRNNKRVLPFEGYTEGARVKRLRRLHATDMGLRLRQMMGHVDATFCAGQQAVVGTGGGKSLLFMLPAYAGSDGMTIVVVPLLALRQDMVTRCAQAQIPAEVFRSKAPPSVSALVVFVTPESAATSGFATFLQRVQGAFRLDRVVVDECYMLLDASAQRIFLTATLPPRDKVRFYCAACIDPVHVQLFRQPTTRANLRYRVYFYRLSRRGRLGGLVAAEVR